MQQLKMLLGSDMDAMPPSEHALVYVGQVCFTSSPPPVDGLIATPRLR